MPPRKKADLHVGGASCTPGPASVTSLTWDDVLRQLWLGDRVIKHFRQPANTQELILGAFQKAG